MKRKHDFVEEISNMKGPEYINSNYGIVKYGSYLMETNIKTI